MKSFAPEAQSRPLARARWLAGCREHAPNRVTIEMVDAAARRPDARGQPDDGWSRDVPAHDFPQKITYRRRGADSIIARIVGPGPNGLYGSTFPTRRSKCLTVTPPMAPDTVIMSVDL